MSEAKKRLGKPVELPFEHPTNRQNFIVKLVVSVGNRVPPTWTLLRGDGPGAKMLWSRGCEDVMILQNQIKVDSVYTDSSHEERPSETSHMSSPGGNQEPMMGGAPAMWGGSTIATGPEATEGDPFGALAQPPSFMQKALPPQPVAVQKATDQFQQVEEPVLQSPAGILLPPPIKLDTASLDHVQASLTDPSTGLMTFPAFLYFLFREYARYQRNYSPVAVLVFEAAMLMGKDMVALPPQAVGPVAQRINSVCLGLEIATYLGGGEFSMMLPSTDGDGALAFAASLDAALKNGPIFQGNERVLVVMGAASIPETCEEPLVLIAAAKQAKEMAKGGSSPCVLFPVPDDDFSM